MENDMVLDRVVSVKGVDTKENGEMTLEMEMENSIIRMEDI